MPRAVCRAGRRGKNGWTPGWPSLGGMQRYGGCVRGGRRTARMGWAPNQSRSESAAGAGGADVRPRGGPRGTRRSWGGWKPCQVGDDDLRGGTTYGYDDSGESDAHTHTQPAVGHTFSSAQTRSGSQVLAFRSGFSPEHTTSVLVFAGPCAIACFRSRGLREGMTTSDVVVLYSTSSGVQTGATCSPLSQIRY